MAETGMEWLPPSCLETRAAVQSFEQLVHAWAADWFQSNPWSVMGKWERYPESLAASWATLRSPAHGIAIQADNDAVLRLALDVLGAAPQRHYTEADLRLLRRFSLKILDDLEDRLSAFQRPPVAGANEDTTWISLLIGTLGQPMIALTCSSSSLVPVVRAGFPQLHPRGPLHSPLQACQRQEIDISAILGKARLRVAEIRQFEIGDVVTLDQLSSQPITLSISSRESSILGCPGEQDGQIILEVAELK
ncbi:FliM/FliN family flagellar motor C-terminal domain-containing protein [Altererythrobacter sp. Z27]|uniref:FliM/FliN family flagellar motor C-terminal domain-containing protein n=1 Tax=Altererythrobacter sp. Z27 TaxID=3461147 RepID=UPI0040444BB9